MEIIKSLKCIYISFKTTKNFENLKNLIFDIFDYDSGLYSTKEDIKIKIKKEEHIKKLKEKGIIVL